MTRIALTLALAAGTAHAGEIVQTYDYTLNGLIFTNDSFTMDSFDTMGGTRQLTDIKVNIDGQYTIEHFVENLEDRAITADEYFFEPFVATTLNLAGLSTGAIASVGWGALSTDLEAADGVEGSGADYYQWNFGGGISNELYFLETFFPAFETNGAGTIEGTLGVFNDLLLTPPPPLFDVGTQNHSHTGSFTLTYIYDTVPAPGTAGVLALAGLAAARRRR
ncbi:MAG: hypothetical protein DHS20C14_15460 [Phycisphaeraceae bacterium]|nr:MAG: hypothetical protein DHS20C14_15460 [Phycisphaeraceae bacterium]